MTKDEEGKLLSKILDFGLAKFYAPMEGGPQARPTREGAVFGTPAYMSPEQARGQVVDRVVDAASGTFGVRLELPNPNYALPAGLKCKVRFPG